jgi:hypothetical protein
MQKGIYDWRHAVLFHPQELHVRTKPAEPLQKRGRALLLAAAGWMAAALLLAFGPLGSTRIHAQATASPSAIAAPAAATPPPVGADGKALTFDVVSIREGQFLPNPQNRPAFGGEPGVPGAVDKKVYAWLSFP